MININSDKPIRSSTIKYILVGICIIVVFLLVVGLFTKKLDNVGPVKFHHEQKADSTKLNPPKIENNSNGIQIQTMNGDIIKDSATKNVYK
jgi:hypothetical protein